MSTTVEFSLFHIWYLQLSKNFSTAPGKKEVKVKVMEFFGLTFSGILCLTIFILKEN